jgi:hypothetical protein
VSQGGNAKANGVRLEARVENILAEIGLEYIKQHKYTSIYGHTGKMDFYLPNLDMAIEVKNQEGAGSVCEKIPYVMENFEQHPAKRGLLVLGGAFWLTRPGITDWFIQKANKSSKHLQVCYFNNLGEWFEQTKNRHTT